MASYAGSALDLQWIHPSGTASLNGDFRSFTVTPAVQLYEDTAGADTDSTYLPGIKNRTMSVTIVDQAGGSVTLDALAEGVVGTLVVGPEGTASTKRRETYPAISQGYTRTQPYNNIVELTVNFQGNGAKTFDNFA